MISLGLCRSLPDLANSRFLLDAILQEFAGVGSPKYNASDLLACGSQEARKTYGLIDWTRSSKVFGAVQSVAERGEFFPVSCSALLSQI